MIPLYIEQGSEEWVQARLGVVTMSHARELMTKGKGITRRNYCLDIASEILTGIPVKRFQSDTMLRGLELEQFALEAYQIETGIELGQRIGFAFLNQSKRVGASPDGVFHLAHGNYGVEIKCPLPRNHMRFIDDLAKHNAHYEQVQGNMWVFGSNSWDFVSYCPEFVRAPLVIHTFQRNQGFIDRLEKSAEEAIEIIDELVSITQSIEYKNPQEIERICKKSDRHLVAMSGEVFVE